MSTKLDLPVTDLASRVMYDDPHPRYAELRRSAPVSYVKLPMGIRGTGFGLAKFEDVAAMHSDERFSTNALENGPGPSWEKYLLPRTARLLQGSMEFKDDPEHKRLKLLVHKAFTPKLVKGMEADIEKITHELLDKMAAKGDVDLVDDFAVRLPLTVIGNLLGVDDEDREQFHVWINKLSEASTKGLPGMIKTLRTANQLVAFLDGLVVKARKNPNEGLISGLLEANEGGEQLTAREVLAMIFLLLLAGHDTTSNLIGSSILTLLENPDQMDLLRAHPEHWSTGVEELLRYTTPVAFGATRIAMDTVEFGGITIPKGSQVLGLIISANRDEDIFDNPDQLDVTRDPNRHLGFAFGPHYCLGHQLARSEATIAMRAFLERFSSVELTVPRNTLRFKSTPSLRGLHAIPLRLR